ncbi:hypothetical protein SAMN02746000_02792 [Paracoccus sp. J56]|nr:hypothetical protein SAMN02746000_02792 [Paracoccus sp. J56]
MAPTVTEGRRMATRPAKGLLRRPINGRNLADQRITARGCFCPKWKGQ